MTAETYALLEGYMLRCMGDSAHDKEHVYRVLYTALDIAGSEREADREVADREVLISAALSGLPIAWKKMPLTICMPFRKQIIKKQRNAFCANSLYSASSWPKRLMIVCGEKTKTAQPMSAQAVAATSAQR